jgi:hypothetical protein
VVIRDNPAASKNGLERTYWKAKVGMIGKDAISRNFDKKSASDALSAIVIASGS